MTDTLPTPASPASPASPVAPADAYEYGWHDSDEAGTNARRGINEDVVRDISARKNEPEWMLNMRLKGLGNCSLLWV